MNHSTTIAIYPSHAEAESAIRELQLAGFDMTKLSIVGRDYHSDEHVVGYYNMGDRVKAWGKRGAFWGGLWGLLVGSAFFFIPGIGPVLVAGQFVSTIVGALEGAVLFGGLSAVGAAFASIGIPKDSIITYESALKAGKFVLIAHSSTFENQHAKDILRKNTPEILDHHERETRPTSVAHSPLP